jgi:crotonobetainyl-CoA:carnitine CoA-transferase CaiB-like acyl-CoA transferase
VAGADVLVHGYRPGALRGLGYAPAALAALRPGLVVAGLSAYGAAGPWAERRGFDSLVQMSAGIAAAGTVAAGADRPVPLPCQLLDHASGYLLALGALRALQRRRSEGGGWEVSVSLARTAHWLDGLGRDEDGLARPAPPVSDGERWCLVSPTPWGDVHHLGPPGAIGTVQPRWRRPPSQPRSDPPAW